VHTAIGQIDSRPMSSRVREVEDENSTIHCKHLPLGQYKVTTGTYKGSVKNKQVRYKHCAERENKVKRDGSFTSYMFLLQLSCSCCV
jgi:hypothetical protein